jgi:RNA polymerase sigma factor (sigma-70 family)
MRCYGVLGSGSGVGPEGKPRPGSVEVSALKYSGGMGLHGRSPLLRLQSDERLIGLLRRGNMAAFEVLVSRYESRLMAFCRHLLGSREDAEDVLQEVLTAAFNAILADDRPINVRPWLYRIARNRSLNHLRRIQAIGVESMDHHFSEHGATTADKVHEREEFRLLVGDIHELPETQKTALVLREMDALSYEQIAEAMETTVPSVKSLLVRARVSLAEAAEARLLSCDEVRIELAEVAEGLQRRPSALVRRHLRSCKRCAEFRGQLKATNKALAALLPVGPVAMLHKLVFLHLGHSAGAGSSAAGAGSSAAGAVGAGAAGAGGLGAVGAGTGLVAGSSALAGSSGLVSAGIGAFAGKAAAGLAAAALVTAGAVEADHTAPRHAAAHPVAAAPAAVAMARPETPAVPYAPSAAPSVQPRSSSASEAAKANTDSKRAPASKNGAQATNAAKTADTRTATTTNADGTKKAGTAGSAALTPAQPAPRTQTQSDPTVLPYPGSTTTPSPGTTTTASSGGAAVDPYPATTAQAGSGAGTSTTPTSTSPGSTSTGTTTTGTSTTTTPTGPTPGPGDGTTTSTGTPTTPGTTTPTTPGDGQPATTTPTNTPPPADGFAPHFRHLIGSISGHLAR